MRKLLIFVLTLLPNVSYSQGYDLQQLRALADDAAKSERALTKLYEYLKIAENSPTTLAYFGLAKSLEAKHAFNPYQKLVHVKMGSKKLNQAVALAPADAEIRFLRFSVESQIPEFLGYSDNLREDKIAILSRLDELDKDIQSTIINFMLRCDCCTPEEIKLLKKIQS